MTKEEKEKIAQMRESGFGYKAIAANLGISANSVKSYCKRNEMAGVASKKEHICVCCGVPVIQHPGRKEKKFCSDRCRMKWWNGHLDQVKRRANYEITCQCCKKVFISYGNAGRKYCSHECYIEDRFGEVRR